MGDYRLVRMSSEGQLTRTWEAEQISMQRGVMLEMLKSLARQDEEVVAAFLADVKAKALLGHPGIGAVYEAVSDDEVTFFARERMEGASLEALYEAGEKLSPLEVVKLLKQISESMRYLESEAMATVDYALHHFVIGSTQELRLMNLAVDGERDEQVDTRAKQLLGAVFDEMMTAGLPGATRVGSLCGFMADLDRPEPLTWEQIGSLSEQVRQQLEGSGPVEGTSAPKAPYVALPQASKIPPAFWALLGGLGLIAAVVALLVLSRGDQKPLPVKADELDAVLPLVEIPEGEYLIGNEKTVLISEGFAMGRSEVTLAQYHAFLEFPDHRKFQHPEQPPSKKDHLPDSWKAIWSAAVKGQQWQGRPMATDCPVVGVDWWDAYAYAKWSGGRLPTLEEWIAAAHFQGIPQGVKAWGPVDLPQDDETGAGLIGMAGSVREWTRDLEVDPDFLLNPKKPLAVGASFLEAEGGVQRRTWFDKRSIRFPDLGFRVISVK